MNSTGRPPNLAKKEAPYNYMRAAIIASAALHVVIVLLLVVGMPYVRPEHKIPEAISVEMATLADITQTNKPPVKAPEPDKKTDEKPNVKTPPKPATNMTPAPPKPAPKKPDPIKKAVEVKADTPQQDELAPPKKDDKKDDKKEQKKPEEQPQFQSLLKNWAKNELEQKADINDLTKKITNATPAPATANVGATMTVSDMDALRQQLSACWNVFAGAAEAGDLAVDVRVVVGSDRVVQNANILDTGRYNSDARFRAAADSALRAVRDPRCSPLRLPPEKYDLWHDMVIVFDPKEML
jgi:hypothetical protein